MIEFNRRETMKKCEGCKRAKGSDTVYTCNCNVESKKDDSVEGLQEYIDTKRSLNKEVSNIFRAKISIENWDKIDGFIIDLLKEYATQHKEIVVSDEEIDEKLTDVNKSLFRKFGVDSYYERCLIYDIKEKLTTKEDSVCANNAHT